MKPLLLTAMLFGLAEAASAAEVIRYKIPNSDFPIAQAVEIPAGQNLVFLSGAGPDIADKSADKDSPAAYGDTKVQTSSTLKKIEANDKPPERFNHAVAAMMIDNPEEHHGSFFSRLFDTHPPIQERIAALEKIASVQQT